MKLLRAAAALAVAGFACGMTTPTLAAHRPLPPLTRSGVLPDSAVIARVGNRVTTVYNYRDRYFSSDGLTRPLPDSLGRVQFLQSMVDKDVMGLTALSSGATLRPNDELMLQRYLRTLLALAMYRKRVEDPTSLTDDEVRAVYEQYRYELRLRYLLLQDEATAERVRGELVRGQITWRDAAKRYSLGPDSLIDGDLGWQKRSQMSGSSAAQAFALRPPGFSPVVRDADGYKIWQCVDRRPGVPPPMGASMFLMQNEARAIREEPLDRAFFAEMRKRSGATFDTSQVIWLADRFWKANRGLAAGGSGLDLRTRVPQIDVSDTSRVVAQARGIPCTVGRVIQAYRDIAPVGRRRIETPAAMFDFVQRMVLEPVIVEEARAEGLEHDPSVMAQIATQREGLLVQAMYEDSVQARLQITPEMRRQYYEGHKHEFVSRERVRYAVIVRLTETGADSVIQQLAHGASAVAILKADSLKGIRGGLVDSLLEGQYHKLYAVLFEELRPGQTTKFFLEKDHVWAVFQVLAHSESRPMAFDEVRDIVNESVENIESERLLNQLLRRWRGRYRIESHPEWLMRMRLTDPTAD